MKRIFLTSLAAVALLLTAARAVVPDPVTHEATEKKSTVTIRTQGELKIVLPGKGEAGFEWQIISNDPRILKPLSDVKPVSAAKSAEGPVAWAITLVAQRPGRSVMRFLYARPTADNEATTTDSREVTVVVK